MFYNFKRNSSIQYNDFIATTSLSGFKFTHCSESKLTRFFWLSVLFLSLYTVTIICLNFYEQYENVAILTVLETIDQGSDLPYPAVYLCLGYPLNPEKIQHLREDIFRTTNISIPMWDLDEPLQSTVRFQRSTRKDFFNVDDLLKYNLNVTRLESEIPQLYYEVDELLKDCHLQGQHYRCRSLFKPVQTGPGFCFAFNSIYTKRSFNVRPTLVRYHTFSELDDDWTIRFTISKIETSLLIFLKDPRELLAMTDFPSFIWNPKKNISKYDFTINHHHAEKKVRTLRQSQRKCIYIDELFPYDDLQHEFKTNFYNRGFCLSYCHAMEFYRYCQCLPFNNVDLMPDLSKMLRICSLNDVRCFEDNYMKVRKTDCDRCLSNCNYTEYVPRGQIILSDRYPKRTSTNDNFFQLTLDLEYWPVLQFRTLIIFGSTELLISLMGLAGLFLGTSLLNVFEGFYVLFVRYLCSYYVNRDYLESEFRKLDEKEKSRQMPCIDMSLKLRLKPV